MKIRSSRFPRASYARRAALLSEDLREWHNTYSTRATQIRKLGPTNVPPNVLYSRFLVLGELSQQLRQIAIQLQTLR